MSYTTSYRFSEVKQSKSGLVHCPQCGKKRTLTVTKSYYRNGFHNELETREKNDNWLRDEMIRLQAEGEICQACHDENNNEPLTEKLSDLDHKGRQQFKVTDRQTGKVLGVIAKEKWGSRKWVTVGLKYGDWDRCFDAKYEAARAFRDADKAVSK